MLTYISCYIYIFIYTTSCVGCSLSFLGRILVYNLQMADIVDLHLMSYELCIQPMGDYYDSLILILIYSQSTNGSHTKNCNNTEFTD